MNITKQLFYSAALFFAVSALQPNLIKAGHLALPSSVSEGKIAPEGETQAGYKIGDKATDFSLLNVDGNMVSLSDFPDAKGFVICFTCNHCPFSVANEDRLIAMDKKYSPQGYPVIAINPNNPEVNAEDSYDNMIVRAEEKGFTFPYLFDEGQQIYPQYGATKTPHIYVLKKIDDQLIVKYIGAIDNSAKDADAVTEKYLENALNDLLAGQDPKVPVTKAIGCSIKK